LDSTLKNTKDFKEWLSPKMSWGHRWKPFLYLGKELFSLNRPVNIVETGCVRRPGAWIDEGQSTIIWDWIVGRAGGTVTSFDISPEAVAACRAMVKHANVIESDSVAGLRAIANPNEIDLLFLDSYDVSNDYRAPLHHLTELGSVYEKLRSGCMIAVDDCDHLWGKSKYVAAFFRDIGVKPVIEAYVSVWVKA
jgi:hypothetical protein